MHVDGHGHGNAQGEQAGTQDPQGFLAHFKEGVRGAVAADAVAGYPQHQPPPGPGPLEGIIQKSAYNKTGDDASQQIGNGDGQLPEQEAQQGGCQ